MIRGRETNLNAKNENIDENKKPLCRTTVGRIIQMRYGVAIRVRNHALSTRVFFSSCSDRSFVVSLNENFELTISKFISGTQCSRGQKKIWGMLQPIQTQQAVRCVGCNWFLSEIYRIIMYHHIKQINEYQFKWTRQSKSDEKCDILTDSDTSYIGTSQTRCPVGLYRILVWKYLLCNDVNQFS